MFFRVLSLRGNFVSFYFLARVLFVIFFFARECIYVFPGMIRILTQPTFDKPEYLRTFSTPMRPS